MWSECLYSFGYTTDIWILLWGLETYFLQSFDLSIKDNICCECDGKFALLKTWDGNRRAVNICLHCSRDCGKVTHVLTDVDTQHYNTGTLLWINNRVLSSSSTQPLQVLSLTRLSEPKVTGSCLWILKPKNT